MLGAFCCLKDTLTLVNLIHTVQIQSFKLLCLSVAVNEMSLGNIKVVVSSKWSQLRIADLLASAPFVRVMKLSYPDAPRPK